MAWRITELDSNEPKAEYELPDYMTENEIEAILQRLVCRNLSADEILSASRRKNDPRRSTLLDRIGSGRPIQYGDNPFYTAERTKT
jgi:hypothetical protein